MTKRIFRSILGVCLAVLAASLVLVVGVLHGYFQDRVTQELAIRTAYIAQGVEQAGADYLEALPESSRVTWIAADGTVLWDNWEDAAQMENHADRQEVHQALLAGPAAPSGIRHPGPADVVLRLAPFRRVGGAGVGHPVHRLGHGTPGGPAGGADAAAGGGAGPGAGLPGARQLVAPINALDLDRPGGGGLL